MITTTSMTTAWDARESAMLVGKFSFRPEAKQIFLELGGLLFGLFFVRMTIRLLNNRHKTTTDADCCRNIVEPQTTVVSEGEAGVCNKNPTIPKLWQAIVQPRQRRRRLQQHRTSTMRKNSSSSVRYFWKVLACIIGGLVLLVRYDKLVRLSRTLAIERGYQNDTKQKNVTTNNSSSFELSSRAALFVSSSSNKVPVESADNTDSIEGGGSADAVDTTGSSIGEDASRTMIVNNPSSPAALFVSPSSEKVSVESGDNTDSIDGSGSDEAVDTTGTSDGINALTTTIVSSASRKLAVCADAPDTVDGEPVNIKSIRAYLSHMHKLEDWVLFKWNPDGSFDHDRAQTTSEYAHWTPPADVLGDAKPSAYGRVVLLLNSDRLPLVPWSVRPPVPVWTYSKPIAAFDPRQLPDPLPARCELDRVSLVPSPYDRLVWNRYCVEEVDRKVQRRTFGEKINKVVWRGAIHFRDVERGRVALLEYAQSHDDETRDWLDVKEINQREDPAHMELHELAEYRYHVDIGGLSGTAWGGLRWKLCTGLLVFKVESWADDWWHDTLEPWVHYIPVNANVTDLPERYRWTQDNPDKAEEIARAGRERCLTTLGEERAKENYQAAVQQLPAAEASIVMEAEDILEQMKRLKTDMRGINAVSKST
jgi:hypothetical protein